MAIPASDPYYAAEVITDELADFMYALAAAYGAPAGAVGMRGNPATHFRGAHRSRRFILFSPYCTNRTYTVSRTAGDKTGGTGNEIAGGDLSLPHGPLVRLCRRVDAAARSGRFEELTEWFGQSDDDQQVEGFDNIANAVATSDTSHLWHIHMTFRRDVLHNRAFFDRLLAAITEETDMELNDQNAIGDLKGAYIAAGSTPKESDSVGRLLNLAPLRGLEAKQVAVRCEAKLDALLAAAGEEVQRDAADRVVLVETRDLVGAIQAGDPTALAEAIVAMAGPDLADRVADLIGRTRLSIEPAPEGPAS